MPPYQWSISSGALPPGLSLSADGVISGTSTDLGTYLFTVRVQDSASGAVSLATHQAVVTADQSDLFYREDFEIYALGSTPTAAWQLQTSIIDGTDHLGSGRALRIQDSSTATGSGLEVSLAPDASSQRSRLRVRFQLRNLAPAQTANGALTFSLGPYSANASATLNANANRSCALEFNRTGWRSTSTTSSSPPPRCTTPERRVTQRSAALASTPPPLT